MKRYIWMAVIALCVMSSCNDDVVIEQMTIENNVINASFENSEMSRVAVGQNNTLAWSVNDQFVVFDANGTTGYYILSGNGGSATGVFTGSLPTGDPVGAAYPFVDIATQPSLSGNTLTMTLPDEIPFEDGICDSPMWAKIESGYTDISFKHLVSMLKIDLSSIPATAGQIIVDASAPIAGKFTADITATGDNLILAATEEATNSIKVTFDPSSNTSQRLFLIPIPVATYATFAIAYANADGSGKTYLKSWSNLAFKRAIPNKTTISIGNLDANLNSDYTVDGDTYTIKTAAGLFWFAGEVNGGNTFVGKTVKLANDINLNNVAWTPIGYKNDDSGSKQFKGTFDGNNNTISNIKIEGTDFLGLFGYIEHDATTIKDLNLSNVNISGNHYIGAIAGYAVGAKIDNCLVEGGTIVVTPIYSNGQYDDGDKVGGITGYTGRVTATANIDHNTNITKCEVKNLQISAYRDLGGIAGYAKAAKIVFTDNKVTGCTLTADQSSSPYNGTKPYNVNTFIGSFDGTPEVSNTSSNVHINKIAMTITTADELMAFATNVNNGTSYVGEIVKLGNDINMTDKTWIPIGNTITNFFKGIFDGCEKTISNLNCTGTEYLGLFGYIQYNNAYIKNVKLKDVVISGRNYVGAIIGRPLGAKIEYCKIEGGSITVAAALKDENAYDWGDKVGGIAGYTGSNEGGGNHTTKAVVSNCIVKGIAIKGYRDMGGVVGCAENTDVANNQIEEVTITVDNTQNYKSYTSNDQYNVGNFTGRIVGSNVTTTENTGTATINYPN